FTQMFLTAVSSWATGLLSDGTSQPLMIMTLVASALLVTGWLTLRAPKRESGLAHESAASVSS
ncbi:MAG: Bcr/CflA family drug resistance efflux transporter, partial [Pseudomonas fluorescens]|nr:Bcr/CflA family drug resistance efflux transporter [Pseudomonas fluorescens]